MNGQPGRHKGRQLGARSASLRPVRKLARQRTSAHGPDL